MRTTSRMKVSAGDSLHLYVFISKNNLPLRLTDNYVIQPSGFSAIGMHVPRQGIFPFFTERNWYAGGYEDSIAFIYLKRGWLFSRAIVFEYFRLERYGRIIFKQTVDIIKNGR